MKYREKKDSDQKNIQKAYDLLLDLIMANQIDIHPTLWVGAMICALAENYKNSDVPFEYFKEDMINATYHYKY